MQGRKSTSPIRSLQRVGSFRIPWRMALTAFAIPALLVARLALASDGSGAVAGERNGINARSDVVAYSSADTLPDLPVQPDPTASREPAIIFSSASPLAESNSGAAAVQPRTGVRVGMLALGMAGTGAVLGALVLRAVGAACNPRRTICTEGSMTSTVTIPVGAIASGLGYFFAFHHAHPAQNDWRVLISQIGPL